MTEQATLTYKWQNKLSRISQRAVPLHTKNKFAKGRELNNFLYWERTPEKSLDRSPQQMRLARLQRVASFAAIDAAVRIMLRSAGQARHDSRGLAAGELLDRINNPKMTPRDREMAVLLAETTVFDGSLRLQLLAELANFIGRNRFTQDRNRITAVCSAVRKFAMNMDESYFEPYGGWLRPNETQTLSSQVELELAKALCWRLAYLPVSHTATCTGLVAALVAVGNAYLLRRWMVEQNFAAVALQAVTAIAILQALSGDRTVIAAMLEQVSSLGLEWFSEVLDDRLQETCEAIGQHDPQLAERLRQLIENKQ